MKVLNVRRILLIGLAFLVLLVWSVVLTNRQTKYLEISFLDIGQGDAIFIEAPNRNQILIDGGPDRNVLRQLSKVMPWYDRHIDVVIATHPDADHIGGLPYVLDNFEVGVIIDPGVDRETNVYKAFSDLVKEKEVERMKGQRGLRIVLAQNVDLTILSPAKDDFYSDPNEMSLVAILRHGSNSFLLTGDASVKIENKLIQLDGQKLKSQVLKVGHHGSNTSTGNQFIEIVSPDYAIISAGKNNRYNHPHYDVLSRLTDFGVTILSTAELGTISFLSDGLNLNQVTK